MRSRCVPCITEIHTMLNNHSRKVVSGVAFAASSLFSVCQPNSPAIVMDYWTGWYDVWGDLHHMLPPEGRGVVLFYCLFVNETETYL